MRDNQARVAVNGALAELRNSSQEERIICKESSIWALVIVRGGEKRMMFF